MATVKRGGKARRQPALEQEFITPPSMTEEESVASRLAYERCKPALDAAMAKMSARLNRPILPLAEETVTRRHVPNVYHCCATHSLPLDPWGWCHHGCKRCERERPFERIWTHKGVCAPMKALLVRGA